MKVIPPQDKLERQAFSLGHRQGKTKDHPYEPPCHFSSRDRDLYRIGFDRAVDENLVARGKLSASFLQPETRGPQTSEPQRALDAANALREKQFFCAHQFRLPPGITSYLICKKCGVTTDNN
jgi:hypothetical protein